MAVIAVVNGYTDLTQLKSRIKVPDTNDDGELERAIEAVSRQIDHVCEQHFYQVVEARTFVPRHRFELRLPAWNTLVTASEVATDDDGDGTFETVWGSTDFQLLTDDGTPNINAAPEPEPYTRIRAVGGHEFPPPVGGARRLDLVRVTGTWGWDAVPTVVREAALILAEETFKLKDAPFGVAGFGEFGAVRVRDNPKAMRLLARYLPLAVI